MSDCITYQNFIDYDSCWSEQLCHSQSRIEMELCSSQEIIEEILCKKICPVSECRLFSGNGTDTLFLKNNLQTLDSLVINEVNQDTLPQLFGNILQYSYCSAKFDCGQSNIKVCGIWGSEIPVSLMKAVIIHAYESLAPGITGATSVSGIKSVDWGDVSIAYSDLERTTGLTTGVVEVDQLIQPFITTDNFITYEVVGNPKCSSNCGCGTESCGTKSGSCFSNSSSGSGEGIEKLSTDPTNPSKGDVWFNLTEGVLKTFDGTTIKILDLKDGAVTDAFGQPLDDFDV